MKQIFKVGGLLQCRLLMEIQVVKCSVRRKISVEKQSKDDERAIGTLHSPGSAPTER
jgi:hypothetical protein